MTGAFVHMFNAEFGGHGAGRKYNPKVHLKNAEIYDKGATAVGDMAIAVSKFNKPLSAFLFGVSGVLDGLKHLSLAIVGRLDPAGVVIDYAVPYSLKPLGPAAGEVASQVTEQSISHLEESR